MGHHHTILIIANAHSYMPLVDLVLKLALPAFSIWFIWLYLDNKQFITKETNEDTYEKGKILSM